MQIKKHILCFLDARRALQSYKKHVDMSNLFSNLQ